MFTVHDVQSKINKYGDVIKTAHSKFIGSQYWMTLNILYVRLYAGGPLKRCIWRSFGKWSFSTLRKTYIKRHSSKQKAIIKRCKQKYTAWRVEIKRATHTARTRCNTNESVFRLVHVCLRYSFMRLAVSPSVGQTHKIWIFHCKHRSSDYEMSMVMVIYSPDWGIGIPTITGWPAEQHRTIKSISRPAKTTTVQ